MSALAEEPKVACSWCEAWSFLDRVSALVGGKDVAVWVLPKDWREFYVGDGSRMRFACGQKCGDSLEAIGSLLRLRGPDSKATLEDLRNARVEETPYLCDACVMTPPEWRYDVPPFTPIMTTLEPATGKATAMQAAGAVGLCSLCKAIVDHEGFGERGARKLAQRTVDVNPKLSGFRGERRKIVLDACAGVWKRLLPVMTNPRPDVRGENSTDGKILWVDGNPSTASKN